MPDVRLTRAEEEGQLPAICMCCGAPATDWVERTFPLHPPAVQGSSGFLEIHAIRVLFAAASTPKVMLRTSFCPRHRHYWRLRLALTVGGLAGVLALLAGGLLVILLLLFVARIDAPALDCCVLAPFLLSLPVWLTATVLVASRTIRVQAAEDGALVLSHVDALYVAALENARGKPAPLPAAIRVDPATGPEGEQPGR